MSLGNFSTFNETRVKTNRELLEATTSFKFPGYKNNDLIREGKEIDVIIEKKSDGTWKVSCALGIYDKAEKDFVSVYAYWNEKPCENTVFESMYDALDVVMELLK